MNAKIKELIEQATEQVSQPEGTYGLISDYVFKFNKEKFAYLIIQECINCCDDSEEEYSKTVDWGVDRIVARFNLKPIQRKEPVPKCSVCGTTENVRYVGGFQPWLCPSVDCIPF